MLNVGIAGVTGYAGQELIRILLDHPRVRISGLFSKSASGKPAGDIFRGRGKRLGLVCQKPVVKNIVDKCDAVFLALPHTASMGLVPLLLKAGKRVIDLSADYRLKDAGLYQKAYRYAHKDKPNLKVSVYGLPELYRAGIRGAKLVANPGCYPTAAVLALAPLVGLGIADPDSIIIDAKSGVSGAGKKAAEEFFASQAREDFKAYKVGVHQHAPEIDQVLSGLAGKTVKVTFVPHLLPVMRGILETIYVKRRPKAEARGQKMIDLYKKFYKKEPFVRVKPEGEFPRLIDVTGTNFCDIGIKETTDGAIIICAIDNLLKGASGQAVQNMNIMYGFPETTGLL
ncbi:MAG: N-acetyl-gamma-glutamyl-phosphate reductase [Candidatus Omnitrophota bacterium]